MYNDIHDICGIVEIYRDDLKFVNDRITVKWTEYRHKQKLDSDLAYLTESVKVASD
jgi:uncharacterized Fe-S radical SAM superfamily protein PflX